MWRGISIWWRAARFHFVPPSFLPAILGGVIAWAREGKFSPWLFSLVVLGVTVNHLALNMTDDYYDYKHAIDIKGLGEGNPYTGGSGTLTSGLIEPLSMLKAFTFLYLVTIAVGLYLTALRGWTVLVFGLFGMACSYFYTAPPIKYAYHGLGEISLLINFGSTIGLGSYYVMAESLSGEAFWATLPLGIMMFSMITINEIPDYEEDRGGGKLTLVARFGREAAVGLYILSLALAYLALIGAALAGWIPPISLMALMTLPLALRSLRLLIKEYRHPGRMAPANLDTIKVHNLTGILLILAYGLYGLALGRPMAPLAFSLAWLALLYAPVAKVVFQRSQAKIEGAPVELQ